MKRKYALLALAMLALSGCGSDEKRLVREPAPTIGNGDNGGDNNTGQPVSNIYYSHIKDSISDAAFTLKIKQFLAIAPDETTADIDIGTVKANSDSQTEGLQVRLNLGLSSSAFTTWTDIDASRMDLEIRIYDSYTYPVSQGGQGLGAIKTVFPAGLGRIEQDGSDIRIIFEDASGMVWLKGNFTGDQFTGRMYFDNANNAYNGAFGNFVFPKCVLFTNGCH